RAGAGAARARLALVVLHGRGAGADGILPLAAQLGLVDAALFAPEAAGCSWWPVSFLEPMDRLQPWLDSALLAVDRAIAAAAEEGFGDDRVVLLGFSQGGCLALEFAARSGRRLRHVIGLSAGLVGTADSGEPPSGALYGRAPKIFDYDAGLGGLPVYIGCHETDPHIPLARVRETETAFRALGAACEVTIAKGAGHGITEGDVLAMRRILLTSA
ncbi:MAG: alpha/beta fold hydrolase, partial [Paracoccaceae bacterium]